MADYVLYNGSASAVEGIEPGEAGLVASLADADLAAALAVDGVAVISDGCNGTMVKELADLMMDAVVTGTDVPNRLV